MNSLFFDATYFGKPREWRVTFSMGLLLTATKIDAKILKIDAKVQ